jgi:hypothetical protein
MSGRGHVILTNVMVIEVNVGKALVVGRRKYHQGFVACRLLHTA